MSPIFDVSNFTVKGSYFAHVPTSPSATNAVLNTARPGRRVRGHRRQRGYFTVLAALRVGRSGRVFALRAEPDRATAAAASHRDQRHHGSCDGDGSGAGRSRRRRRAVLRLMLAGERRHLIADAVARDRWPAVAFARIRRFPFASGRSIAGCASARPPRIDLMKIDVEGAELQECSPACRATFAQPASKTDHLRDAARERCRRVLRDRGYRVSILDEIPRRHSELALRIRRPCRHLPVRSLVVSDLRPDSSYALLEAGLPWQRARRSDPNSTRMPATSCRTSPSPHCSIS